MKALFLSLLLLLAGCATNNLPPGITAPKRGWLSDNDCVPAAIQMAQGLRKYDIPAKVLILHTSDGRGHAVCAYLYPGKDLNSARTWVWDRNWGSAKIWGQWKDPLAIGHSWWHHVNGLNSGAGLLKVTVAEETF